MQLKGYARFADPFGVAMRALRPAVGSRGDLFAPGAPYTAFQSTSDGTKVSGSAATPSAIRASSARVFLWTVGFFDITVDLAIVGLTQTYDPQSRIANRKYHSMKAVADQSVGENPTFGVVAPEVGQVACGVPRKRVDLIKADAVDRLIRRVLRVIPFQRQHHNHPCPSQGGYTYV